MNKNITPIIILLVFVLITLSMTIYAEVPNIMSYQGRLTDGDGVPKVDGVYLLRFNLYDSNSEGAELWSSDYRTIQVTEGFFSYLLGDTVAIPDSVFAKYSDVWLGIKVSSDPEITPRIRIASVGYAFRALHSDTSKLAENAMLLDNNTPTYFLDWDNQVNIPPGFADGIDDVSLGVESGYVLIDSLVIGNDEYIIQFDIFDIVETYTNFIIYGQLSRAVADELLLRVNNDMYGTYEYFYIDNNGTGLTSGKLTNQSKIVLDDSGTNWSIEIRVSSTVFANNGIKIHARILDGMDNVRYIDGHWDHANPLTQIHLYGQTQPFTPGRIIWLYGLKR
jgi:hypothetical protein